MDSMSVGFQSHTPPPAMREKLLSIRRDLIRAKLKAAQDQMVSQYQTRVAHVADPRFTMMDWMRSLANDMAPLTGKKQISKKEGVAFVWKQLKCLFKITRELKRSEQYLPAHIRHRVSHYKWTTYWWDRLVTNRFKPGFAQQKLVNLKGPLAIKSKQAQVGQAELMLDNSLLDSIGSKNKMIQLAVKTGRAWSKRYAKIYGPLVDSTPPLPASYFQQELRRLNSAYQTQHGESFTIRRPLGAGSIGQVFLADTPSGRQLAVKVLRPDANIHLLNDYDAYLYRQGLVLRGVEHKFACYQEALGNIQILRQEADLLHEKNMATEFAAWVKQEGITSFEVPHFYTATQDGFVQRFVGNSSLGQLKRQGNRALSNQVLLQTGNDFIHAYVLSPKKYFDWHLGNVLLQAENGRMMGKPYLVDYGRAVRFNDAAHRDLMQSVVDVLKQAKPATVIKSGLEGRSLTPNMLDTLFYGVQDSILKGTEKTPTAVNFWANYAGLQAQHPSLKSLTPMPLSHDAQRNITDKFKAMLSHYFSVEADASRDIQAVQRLSAADFSKLVSWSDWDGKRHSYVPAKIVSKAQRQMFLDTLGNNQAFEQAKKELLATEEGRGWLALTYRQNHRCKAIAAMLADKMVKISGSSVSSSELRRLANHLEHGLRHDFSLLLKKAVL